MTCQRYIWVEASPKFRKYVCHKVLTSTPAAGANATCYDICIIRLISDNRRMCVSCRSRGAYSISEGSSLEKLYTPTKKESTSPDELTPWSTAGTTTNSNANNAKICTNVNK